LKWLTNTADHTSIKSLENMTKTVITFLIEENLNNGYDTSLKIHLSKRNKSDKNSWNSFQKLIQMEMVKLTDGRCMNTVFEQATLTEKKNNFSQVMRIFNKDLIFESFIVYIYSEKIERIIVIKTKRINFTMIEINLKNNF